MLQEKETTGVLTDVDFFKNFRKSTIDFFESRLIEEYCPQGQAIFRRGDASKDLMILAEGTVFLSCGSESGEEIVIDIIAVPAVFGCVGVLDGKPREINAYAKTNVRLYKLGSDDFAEIFLLMDGVETHSFLKLFCDRQRRLTENFMPFSSLNPEKKIVKKLKLLCDRLPQAPHYELYISQEELSKMLGIPHDLVEGCLRELAAKRLLQMTRTCIHIPSIRIFDNYLKGLVLGMALSD